MKAEAFVVASISVLSLAFQFPSSHTSASLLPLTTIPSPVSPAFLDLCLFSPGELHVVFWQNPCYYRNQ